MINEMTKYFIMGTKEELDQFFERAQEQGFLEFISATPKKKIETPVTVHSLLQAIKILKKHPIHELYQGGGDLLLAMQVSERIIELSDDLEKLYDEKRVLDEEISRVSPFGDFSMDDVGYIEKKGKRVIQFFCMKSDKSSKTRFPPEVLYVNTESDLDYFITLNREPITIPGMIEMRIDAPLGELENRLDFVEDSILRFENELKEHSGYIEFLHDILVEELNKHHLITAKKEVAYPLQNSLFIAEVWLPQNKVHHLHGLIDGMNIHAEQISIDKNDKIPTSFENKGLGLVGEDLVKIYDVPSTSDLDPSRWVLWFFALFFAVIVGDAGYGFIFLLIALYMKIKFRKIKAHQKSLLNLFFVLSFATITWGVLSSAYFGIHLRPGNALNKISPMYYLIEKKADYHLQMKDDVYNYWLKKYPQVAAAQTGQEMLTNVAIQQKGITSYPIIEDFTSTILLELTLVMGIVHLSTAFLRYLRRSVAGLGWIVFMVGGYLFFPSLLNATNIVEFLQIITKPTAIALGLQCLYCGVGFSLVAAMIQHGWKGINEIGHMMQVFADVLSYLRLYALSLAGMIIASTFNHEGSALGLFFGFIVILFGHALNIGLAFMGGIIHGLRLNFLEWYHYCFDGGGRLFKPLHKIKIR